MGKLKDTERQLVLHRPGAAGLQVPLTRLFSDNLKTLRTKKGLSITQASTDLGVAKSTWCQWEKGHRFPPGFFLELLTEYFDVPPGRFLALRPDECFSVKDEN